MKKLDDIEFNDLLTENDILENSAEVQEVIEAIENIEVPNTVTINNMYKLKVLTEKQKEFFISTLEEKRDTLSEEEQIAKG